MTTYRANIKPEIFYPYDTENLCRRCDRCCSIKKVVDGKVIFTDQYCPHLQECGDGSKKTFCDVYDHHVGTRFEFDGKVYFCLSAEQSYKHGGLPTDCPCYQHFQALEILGNKQKSK